MKKVSLSQFKSSFVGRRQSSRERKNNRDMTPIKPNDRASVVDCETQPIDSSAASLTPDVAVVTKTGLRTSNNLLNTLRYKWKKKRGSKIEEKAGQDNQSADGSGQPMGQNPSKSIDESFVPKKLRSRIGKSICSKKSICPMPSPVHCTAMRRESDETLLQNFSIKPLADSETISHPTPVPLELHSAFPLPKLIVTEETRPVSPSQAVTFNSGLPVIPFYPENAANAREKKFHFSHNLNMPNSRPGSLTRELFKLARCGWYWGPITRSEAEEKLSGQPDGAFLVRDSSDDRYLLSLSFRSCSNTLHTRIEHSNGLFSFYAVQQLPSKHCSDETRASQNHDSEGQVSIVALIEDSMSYSQSGIFCYSRGQTPHSPSYPVRLTKPVSRFNQVRTLQYLCRFVIRQLTRFDHIQKLPLPNTIKGYLEESHY